MTKRKKNRQSRELKSSTSFVHHPQARSHKAVSQVTTRAANIQRRRSQNEFKCLGREVEGPSFRRGPSVGGRDCVGHCPGLEVVVRLLRILQIDALSRRSWR